MQRPPDQGAVPYGQQAWQPAPVPFSGVGVDPYAHQAPQSAVSGALASAGLLDGVPAFARAGIQAYGERMLGSGRQYVNSNFLRYFSGANLQYYFQVNNQYVLNKLRIILCPFLHRGSWSRVPEQVAGRVMYKTPRFDINAPDLYVPLMAFSTYAILCSIAMGVRSKFKPEVLSTRVSKAVFVWLGEAFLIRIGLYALATPQTPLNVPFLDLLAYCGYIFVPVCLNVAAGFFSLYMYYGLLLWHALCTGVFLVKTMKRVVMAEARSYNLDSARRNYMLLALGLVQIPLALWLGLLS